jgi:hypothetical protein
VVEKQPRPAFYAAPAGGWRGWWTLLHPPYTAWHLSYVVIGSTLAPSVDGWILLATLAAFFLAMGVSAHALDELNGRPLRTQIPAWALLFAAIVGLAGAVAIGLVTLPKIGFWLIPFILLGVFLVLVYTLELFGGHFHSDATFALAWGAFPVVTAYFAQAQRVDPAALIAGFAAYALSRAQRTLSTPARKLRRRVSAVDGSLTLKDGTVEALDHSVLLKPLEAALKSLSWTIVALALALAAARLA